MSLSAANVCSANYYSYSCSSTKLPRVGAASHRRQLAYACAPRSWPPLRFDRAKSLSPCPLATPSTFTTTLRQSMATVRAIGWGLRATPCTTVLPCADGLMRKPHLVGRRWQRPGSTCRRLRQLPNYQPAASRLDGASSRIAALRLRVYNHRRSHRDGPAAV